MTRSMLGAATAFLLAFLLVSPVFAETLDESGAEESVMDYTIDDATDVTEDVEPVDFGFGADDTEEGMGQNHIVVTPTDSCLDKLPPQDAAAIRGRSLKPYEECHKALARIKTAPKPSGKTQDSPKSAADDGDTPAENYRNYLRVKPDPGEEAETEGLRSWSSGASKQAPVKEPVSTRE